MIVFASKTDPNLVRQRDQKVWLSVQGKDTQQNGDDACPGGCFDDTLAWQFRLRWVAAQP